MHPFRTLPDTIDGVICGNCGHAVWDHCTGEACAECSERGDRACRAFALKGFVPAAVSLEVLWDEASW